MTRIRIFIALAMIVGIRQAWRAREMTAATASAHIGKDAKLGRISHRFVLNWKADEGTR